MKVMPKTESLGNQTECLIDPHQEGGEDSACGRKHDSFELIEHMDKLYSYAMVLTQNPSEAEDLVQETYVRAIKAVGRLPPGSSIRNWLITILRNTWFTELRRKRASPVTIVADLDQVVEDATVETGEDPYNIYVTRVTQERVRAAIHQLPGTFREIILLREYEELTYQEIAKFVNCPIGTVMSRMARARFKLRNLLLKGQERPHVRVNK
jgi:RNA polymerase sigma-70 factor (ECF subfamily)